MVASPDAVINGVKVGRYLQTYSKRDIGPRLGFAYDVARQRQDDRARRLRTVLEFHTRRHFVVEGAEPALPAGAGADDEPGGRTSSCRTGWAHRRECNPELPQAGNTRSAFLTDVRDAHAHNFNVNLQRQFGSNYMVEAAYSGSRTKNALLKIDLNQAKPTVGVTDQNVNRPFALGRAAPDGRHGVEYRLPREQRSADQVPAPVVVALLVPQLVHAWDARSI